MGKIDYIENLENQVDELSKTVDRIRNASDYINAIEQTQETIYKANESLENAKDRLGLIQSVVESKLDLLVTNINSLDSKNDKNIEELKRLLAVINDQLPQFKKDIYASQKVIQEDILALSKIQLGTSSKVDSLQTYIASKFTATIILSVITLIGIIVNFFLN